ncbi:MAG: sulfatase-like hydrolase/transferase [Promethearchaeota archaeon]
MTNDKKHQPNIIFIFSDQQRWDTMGCYGQELPVTPNLDQLAREGILFDNAITPQPVCGPARSCLQTGLYATQTGCYRNAIALDPHADTLAKRLTIAGYEVGYIGKWHLASTTGDSAENLEDRVSYVERAIPPERRGGYKDFWLAADALEHTSHGYEGGHMWNGDMEKVEFGGYRVDKVTDFVVDYLNTRDGIKPFFLFLSYIEPHQQNDRNTFEGPPGSKQMFKDYRIPGDLEGTMGDWKENYPDYLGCCHSIDENFKRIRDILKERGIEDNTLIIYTSDHGNHFRTRNNEYKRTCHEDAVHVPLIIKGPGFLGGKKIDALVSLLDLVPTVLDAAGVPVPGHVQGKKLQDVVNGSPADWRKEVFIQISEAQVGRAIRTGKWKYSVSAPGLRGWYHASSNYYIEEFLYDLERDPHEKRNLVADVSLVEVRKDLKERLKRHMELAGEEIPVIISKSRIPADILLNISGMIHLDDNGLVVMEIIPLDLINAATIGIPLGELLEEILDVPITLQIANKRHNGKIVLDENGKLGFDGNDGTKKNIVQLLEGLFGEKVQCVALLPELSGESGNFSPKYHILFFRQ